MRIRIHNKHQSKHYYALPKDDARRVNVVGVMGLLSLIALLVGFYFFSNQSLLIALVCVPFFVIVALYHLINFWLMATYPGFNMKQHKQLVAKFKKRKRLPKVAVFIPAAGEAIKLVEKTVRRATMITYPNYEVFLLDDSKEGIYKAMVEHLGATYMRRKDIGHHKKAGNMNAALKKIKGFSHVLVLDADFVPRKEIIEELIPYAKRDVGIVQSPQHFDLGDEVYNRSKIEYGAGMIQRDFYRITQVARNRVGGAICVGTNALYSISALNKVGGFEGVGKPEWGHSEDVHTGLKMLNAENSQNEGYSIRYVPVQLAKGVCPDDHLSFYKQQNRWATGSMQLTFSRKTLFSKKLSLKQKVTYFSNSVYYFYTMGLLFAPVQLLILLLSPREYDWSYTLLFIPMLVVSYILTPFLLRQKVEPIASSVVVISNAYTFVQALWLLIVRRPLGWEATGAKGPSTKKNTHFMGLKLISSGSFIVIYLATLTVLIMNYDIGFNPSTFITFIFLASFIGHLIYLHFLLTGDLEWRRLHIAPQSYGYIALGIILIATVFTSLDYGQRYDVKADGYTTLALVSQPAERNARPEVSTDAVAKSADDNVVEEKPKEATRLYSSIYIGGSQSSAASDLVNQFRDVWYIDDATAGKLQDKVMHRMGYSDIVAPDHVYSFTVEELAHLVQADAYVQIGEEASWAEYSILVGVST